MNESNKTKKELILFDSIVAFISGKLIEIICPEMLIFALLLEFGCLIGVEFCIITNSKYDKIFKNCKLMVGQATPLLKGRKKTDYGSTIYTFTLPAGLSVEDFRNKQQAIENYIGKDIKIDYGFKDIIIEEYDEKMKDFYKYIPQKIDGYVPILSGYTRQGNLYHFDLGDGEPHLMIAGETGSGKSTVIRCILVNLILFSNVKLHLVDLKNGVEFRLFADCKNVVSFSRTTSQTLATLQQLDAEVNRRYNEFYKYNVKDIKEYNKKFRYKKLDYELLVIDEFADLQKEKESMNILENLGRKARACGIHCCLATQRPEMKVISGAIKNNIPTSIGLKTSDGINSRIIIDKTGLENLRGKGHGIVKRDGKYTEVQAPFVSPDEAVQLIKHTYIKKKYVEDTPNTKKTNGKKIEYIEVEQL